MLSAGSTLQRTAVVNPSAIPRPSGPRKAPQLASPAGAIQPAPERAAAMIRIRVAHLFRSRVLLKIQLSSGVELPFLWGPSD